MLSSTIKSNAFIPYKKSCFYKMTNLQRRKALYCQENVLYQAFTRNISIIVSDHVKFYAKCF